MRISGGDQHGVRCAPKSVGRKHHDEIDGEAAPVDLAQVGDARRDVAAEHVHDNLVAKFQAEPSRDFLFERDERRSIVIRRPPFAFDDIGAFGQCRGISDAAIAFQRPGGVLADLDVLGAHPRDLDETPAHHRRLLEFRARTLVGEEAAEIGDLRTAHIEEIKARRFPWQRRAQLPAQVGVDQRQRHQHGEAKAERHHDGRRQRAGSMNVGDGHAPLDAFRTRRAARQRHQAERDEPQRKKAKDCRADDCHRHGLVGAGEDRQSGKRQRRDESCDEIAPTRPSRAFHEVAKQLRHRQIVRAAERGNREQQSRQQAVQRAERQSAGKDRGREREGDQRAEKSVHREGERGADDQSDEDSQRRYGHEFHHGQREDRTAARADGFENRQRLPFALDKTLRRVGDADPADDERGQADQREKLGEAIDVLGELRRDAGARSRLPASLRKCRLCGVDEILHRAFAGRLASRIEQHARGPSHQRSRLHKARGVERFSRDQHARAKAKTGGKLVRLCRKRCPQGEAQAAKFKHVADLEIETRQQCFVHRRAIAFALFGDGVRRAHRRREDGLTHCRP